MTEQTGKKNTVSESHATDALIAGRNISFYWRTSRFFIAILVTLEIISVVFNFWLYSRWVIAVIVSVLFTFWLARRSRVGLTTAVAANIILGTAAGLILAFFDIIWYHKWWYILNVIRMPFLLGLIGLVTSIIFYFLFRSIIIHKQHKAVKGGGTYARK